MNKLDDLSFGPNGQERSLYLNFLAVSPDSRKLGLGGKLINHVKAVADGQKVDLTLNAEHEHLVSPHFIHSDSSTFKRKDRR